MKKKDELKWVNPKDAPKPYGDLKLQITPERIDAWAKIAPKPDMVNSPKHYKDFDVETIDMMIRIWGKEKVASHCYITAFKYKMRAGSKIDALEDLNKAEWYLAKAKELSDGSK